MLWWIPMLLKAIGMGSSGKMGKAAGMVGGMLDQGQPKDNTKISDEDYKKFVEGNVVDRAAWMQMYGPQGSSGYDYTTQDQFSPFQNPQWGDSMNKMNSNINPNINPNPMGMEEDQFSEFIKTILKKLYGY